MREYLQILVETWVGYKVLIADFIGLTNDALHVHGSLLIMFAAALILRRRPDSVWCWIIVFVAELFNEYADFNGIVPGEASIDAAVHDLYNTMFWPTLILLVGRFLFPPRIREAPAKQKRSGQLADQPLEQPAAV